MDWLVSGQLGHHIGKRSEAPVLHQLALVQAETIDDIDNDRFLRRYVRALYSRKVVVK